MLLPSAVTARSVIESSPARQDPTFRTSALQPPTDHPSTHTPILTPSTHRRAEFESFYGQGCAQWEMARERADRQRFRLLLWQRRNSWRLVWLMLRLHRLRSESGATPRGASRRSSGRVSYGVCAV